MFNIEVGVNLFIFNLKIIFKEILLWNPIKKKKQFLIESENIRLEAASLVNDIAEINQNIEPVVIRHNFKIMDSNLMCDLYYEGIVRKNNIEDMMFSFSTSNKHDFNKMDCNAYEYVENKEIPTNLRLVGTDGQTKKIAVRFLNCKNKKDTFKIRFRINLGKCITSKREYILSQFKYAKTSIIEYTVNIEFNDFIPKDIRVYELNRGKMKYKKTITSANNIFYDNIKKVDNISFRVYVFDKE